LAVPGINEKIVQAVCEAKAKHNFDIQITFDLPPHTEIIEYTNEQYPQLLKTIYDPPPFLFARGNMELLNELCLAVVGTRRASLYGLRTASKISAELAQAGFTIVSGLADGIDAVSHQAALDAFGNTIAVLGCGIDVVYPASNQDLYRCIFDNGLVISEFLPGQEPSKYTFPKRNRIISGLSKGVLFVEGPRKSGAMITVDFALEQGRDVFAVPGNIDNESSAGAHWLIQHGAKLTHCTNDILEEYGMAVEPVAVVKSNAAAENVKSQGLDSESRQIIEALKSGEQNVEILSQVLDIDVAALQARLTVLELKGIVKRVSGKVFGLV
jgi:DNA processing protein